MGLSCAKGSRKGSHVYHQSLGPIRPRFRRSSRCSSQCVFDYNRSELLERQISTPSPISSPILSKPNGLLPDFTNYSPQQTVLDNTSNPVQHTRTRMKMKPMPNLHTDTALQQMKYLRGSESMPNLHIELQPLSRMKYLQKYNRSYSVAICDHKGGVVTSEDGAITLTIPSGAIMDGDFVTFYFVTCLFGPFILPSHRQTDLASPYYWIGVSESYLFHKPIKVEFEHFAVVSACDPSHFQLFSCEDDDESFTMRPVDYGLSFSVQDGISWCTFQTNNFCSYCLFHHCHHDHQIVTRIGAFYLKPKNFQSLDKFTVHLWFSFPIRHCLKRNKELFTSKGMVLDTDHSCTFEATSDKSSTSYFSLEYDQYNDGWNVSHFPFNKINTKEINFYNYYQDMESLQANEEVGLFPPRFILEVEKKHNCTNSLNTIMRIDLMDENSILTGPIPFPLSVPISMPKPVSFNINVNGSTTHTSQRTSIPFHHCAENRPDLRDIVKYSEKISPCWKPIAYELGVCENKVSIIEIDHQWSVEEKCTKFFKIWLEKSHCCWCHFIQALDTVGLSQVAQEAKAHIKLSEVEQLGTTITDHDLSQLEKFLKHVPDQDLKYFIFQLLSKDSAVKVFEDIKHNEENKKDNIKTICYAFSKEKDCSWTKVYKALKETGCDDLADIIKAAFL